MAATLVAIAVLLGLVLLLLAVPLKLAFRVEGLETFGGKLTLHWLFGLVRFRIRFPRKLERPARDKATATARAEEKPAGRGAGFDLPAALRQAVFRRRVYRLVKDLLRAARPQGFQLWMRLGLGDPADTGRLWALVAPLQLLAQTLRDAQVRIEPDFVDAVFAFRAQGRLRLIPLQVLALVVAFVLSPASIRGWRAGKDRHA